MNRFYALLVISLIASKGVAQVQVKDNVIDEVIWIIGDEVILHSDVENVCLQMQLEQQDINEDPYCAISEHMAIQKLYLHQAKMDSIKVPDSQVFNTVEKHIKYAINQIGSREKLEEYLGKSIYTIREEWRQAMKEQLMVQEVQNKLVSKMKVTPADVCLFYRSIPHDSLPFVPTTVEVEIITLEPKINIEEIDNIKRRLREYTELVTSGKRKFSTLARMYSEDIETAKHGGELGFVGKATLAPEFASVAFELNDPKKVSRIVETEYGYHIIQFIEKCDDRINIRHILLKPRATREEVERARSQLNSVRTEIENGKITFEEAVASISQDKDTRNNKGLMINTYQHNRSEIERTGTSHFEMKELPIEIAKTVCEMKVGDISRPFTMKNYKQKEIVAIVKLKSRSEGHKAGLEEDYQLFKTIVEQNKREEILNKWITKKQKNTYIRISDNLKNCNFQTKGWIIE